MVFGAIIAFFAFEDAVIFTSPQGQGYRT